MPKALKVLSGVGILGTLVGAGFFLFSGTPKWGQRLELKTAQIKSIDLYWGGTTRKIAAADQCAQVMQTLCLARQSAVPATPALGTLTLHYTDGSTGSFSVQPCGRFSALEIAGDAGGYAISSDQLLATFHSVGLMTKED